MCSAPNEMNSYRAVDHTIDMVEQLWQRVMSAAEKSWRLLGLDARLQAAKVYAVDHPVITVCVIITSCMCSIPIMCFVFFVMGSLFLTFLGFLFVEGFLLTFGSILLGGSLFIMGLLSLGASSFLALAWYLVSVGSGITNKLFSRSPKNQPSAFSNPSPLSYHGYTNGECVKDESDHTEKED